MATALALQRLTNFLAGQPGSKNDDIPQHFANTSDQVRLLAYADDHWAASWYTRGANGHYTLLIHPYKFLAFVNLELLPAIISDSDNLHATLIRTDPLHVQTWHNEAQREAPSSGNQDTTT